MIKELDFYTKKIVEYDYRISLLQFMKIDQYPKDNQEILYRNLLFALENVYTRTWNIPDD